MNNSNQKAAVLNYMETHGNIDQLTALSELGVMRLTSRIGELRKMGFEIADEWQTNPKTGKRWKAYRLR